MALAVFKAVKRGTPCLTRLNDEFAHHIFVSSSFCSYCVNDSLNSSFAGIKTWDILIVITNLTNRLGLQATTKGKEGCCPFCRAKDSITNVSETTSQSSWLSSLASSAMVKTRHYQSAGVRR